METVIEIGTSGKPPYRITGPLGLEAGFCEANDGVLSMLSATRKLARSA